jgi:hypothetical protein
MNKAIDIKNNVELNFASDLVLWLDEHDSKSPLLRELTQAISIYMESLEETFHSIGLDDESNEDQENA